MSKSHVVVVGGGLAGLSCALSCVDGDARVTVLESSARLGGATWSFERNGRFFDNGQHVFLRCCSAYRGFLERVGSSALAPVQERLRLPVLRPSASGGVPDVGWIASSHLPAPAHLLPSVFSYPFLSLSSRLRVGRAVRALQGLRLGDPALDDVTFGEFLRRHGQDSDAISTLWDLIVLPTVNLHADEASLSLAAKVFKTGLLADPSAADIGWSRVPLSSLHGEPASLALEHSGADVRLRAKVTAVEIGAANNVKGVVVDGEHLDADAVVLAVPHEEAAELLPRGGRYEPASFIDLGRSPIIDVHIVYDRKVMDFDLAACVGSPIQYVFDRTEAGGSDQGEQCLAISVSNADAEHGERPEVLIDRYTRAIAELFPRARSAWVIDAVVSREHAATFRGRPGSQRLRPCSETGIDGLFLAGAWLDTGWPATMEGAVRSGTVAAGHALAAVGSHRAATPVYEEVVA